VAIPQDHAYQKGMIAVCEMTAMNGRAHDSLLATAPSRSKVRRTAFTGSSGCKTTDRSRQGWSSGIPAITRRASTSTTCRWGRRKTTLLTGTSGNDGVIGGSRRSFVALADTDWRATTWSSIAVAVGASLVGKNAISDPNDPVMRCPWRHKYIWRERLCSECGKRAD